MSSPKTCAEFILRVATIFPAPKFAGDEKRQELWSATIASALLPFDDEVVLAAAQYLIQTRGADGSNKSFPKPAECIAACEEQARLMAGTKLPLIETSEAMRLRDPKSWQNDYTAERHKLADDLCQTPLGERAAREGWLMALHDFIRKHQRVPNDKEVGELVGLHESLMAAHQRREQLQAPDKIDKCFREMMATMLRRRDELATKLFNAA